MKRVTCCHDNSMLLECSCMLVTDCHCLVLRGEREGRVRGGGGIGEWGGSDGGKKDEEETIVCVVLTAM